MTATLDGTNGLILDPSGQPIQNVSTINSGYLYGNRVINGAQEIDQVNSGAAVTPATSFAYLTDMFGAVLAQSSKLTFQQVADAPTGLKNSMKVTVAAQYSPLATDQFCLLTAIEGKDVIDFQLGTAGAATITLSNYIKGSVAGTYTVALWNNSNNRTYVGTVTVTTSWSQVKITLTGDTSGTWATDNTAGLLMGWDLGSGTNFNGTAGVWQAGNLRRTSGSVTFVNQVAGSTLNITGVDCRLGSVAPAYFERRANELQLAQRYYQAYTGISVLFACNGATSLLGGYMPLLTTMRTAPTGISLTTGSYTTQPGSIVLNTFTLGASTPNSLTFNGTTGGSLTTGNSYSVGNVAFQVTGARLF
jgi:hypothetical protein